MAMKASAAKRLGPSRGARFLDLPGIGSPPSAAALLAGFGSMLVPEGVGQS